MGWVYLLLEVDKYGEEYFKIGVSKNDPNLRIKNLKTGNPNKIEVLKIYNSKNYLKIEKMLHNQYMVKTEANNEWRNLTNDEVFSFLDECKKFDEIIKYMLENNPFYN
jgi:hypothetical protein